MHKMLTNIALLLASVTLTNHLSPFGVRSSKLKPFNETQNAPWIYTELMLRIQEEGTVETCFIFADAVDLKQHHFLIGIIEQHLRIPMLLYETQTVFNNSLTFKDSILTVMLLKQPIYNVSEIKNLASNLNRLRHTRILFIGRGSTEPDFMEALSQLFLLCEAGKMLNAIAIFDDFVNDEKYYSYHSFPEFRVEILDFRSPIRELYPSRMRNLHGFPIRTIPDQRIPRSVVYYDQHGKQQTAGYVHKFLKLYARKHNASIVQAYPVKVGEVLYRRGISALVVNNVIDIPTGLCSPDEVHNYNDYYFTYPLEVASLCLIVPMEQPKTNAYYFKSFLSWQFLLAMFCMRFTFASLLMLSRKLKSRHFRINWPDIMYNMHMYSGQLGFAFPLHRHPQPTMRVVYFLIFFVGLMVNVYYNTLMSSFLTSPPLEAPITTWLEFLQSPLKLLIAREEYEEHIKDNPAGYAKNMETIKVVETFKEFADVRDGFNASYGYPVGTSRWDVFKSQQSSFTRPLYRHTDVCFRPMIHNCFMLDSNSIFLDTLDRHIMLMQEMGILEYWIKSSLYEFVGLGNLTLKKETEVRELPRLSMSDFHYVWRYILTNWCISAAIFTVEWLVHVNCKKEKVVALPKEKGVKRRKRKVFKQKRNVFETHRYPNEKNTCFVQVAAIVQRKNLQ